MEHVSPAATSAPADLLDGLDGIVWVADARTLRITYINPSAVEILGYPLDAWVESPQSWVDRIHPSDRGHTLSMARAVANDGVERECEQRVSDADGRERWFLTKIRARPAGGRPARQLLGLMVDITGPMQVLHELLDEQRMLSARAERRAAEWEGVLSSIADGVWVFDAHGDCTFANDAARRITGVSDASKLLESQASLIDYFVVSLPDGSPMTEENSFVSAALRGETLRNVEIVIRERSHSERRSLRMSVAPIRGSAGEVLGAVLTTSDVTELKKAETERERLLREIDARHRVLQAVVENAPAAIGLFRGAHHVCEVANPVLRRLLPTAVEEGRPAFEAPSSPEGARLHAEYDRVLETMTPLRAVDQPFVVRRAADTPTEEVHFTYSLVPLDLPGGERGVLAVGSETTESVKARRHIEQLATLAHERAAELETTINNMLDAVLVAKPDGRIVLANDSASRLFGLPSRAPLNVPVTDLATSLRLRHTDGRDVSPDEVPLARALRGEVVSLEEETAFDSAGNRDLVIRTNAAPIRSESGQVIGAVGVAHDVTEFVMFERAKDQFIRVSAHELKTPVAIMKGCAQMLLRHGDRSGQSRQKALESIVRGADRIDRIVNDLLYLSQIDTGAMPLTLSDLEIRDLVDRVVRRVASTLASHEITIRRADRGVVRGDQLRLEQTVSTLLDNAVRYSPGREAVVVDVVCSASEVTVSVTDKGVGIPAAKQQHIFERFYRAHTDTPHDYGGMGVGLYIAHEIIARHGGSMTFSSSEGQGSTFSFRLPLRGENGGAAGEDDPRRR